MVVDSHQHLMLPTEAQIDKLDNAGVDKAILFCTTPHPERASTLSELREEMSALFRILAGTNSKEANKERMKLNIQELTQALEKYPERLYGFGAVPFGLSTEETVDWLEKYVVANGLKGVGEFTPGNDEQIQQLETVFQALEQFPKLPVWVHTFHPVTSNGIKVLMDLTRKYPNTSVIYGHMGGYHWMEVIDFAKSVPNAYLDLSASFSTLAAGMAVKELPEKCLYGSDAPYGEPLLSKQLVELISPSDHVRDQVLGGNILSLIGEENR